MSDGRREPASIHNAYVPLLSDLAPDGFFYGGHYIIEFDPDSLWYETSLTITAQALRKGIKTEYHVFQHFPTEAREALTRMGLDTSKLEAEGLLNIWDSYTPTVEYQAAKKQTSDPSSIRQKPLNVKKSGERWTERSKKGFTEKEKGWLHLDDNSAIFLQYNDEEEFIDAWRTTILPYSIRARETPHFLGFVKGLASSSFYTKFEAL